MLQSSPHTAIRLIALMKHEMVVSLTVLLFPLDFHCAKEINDQVLSMSGCVETGFSPPLSLAASRSSSPSYDISISS